MALPLSYKTTIFATVEKAEFLYFPEGFRNCAKIVYI